MPERGKEDKMWGVAKKKWVCGMPERGKETKFGGGGWYAKKIEGGMPERGNFSFRFWSGYLHQPKNIAMIL